MAPSSHGVDEISELVVRLAPALIAGFALLFLLPKRQALARCFVHIGIFAVIRDTFTPLGLWKFETRSAFYIRLPDHPAVLVALALGSGLLVGTVLWMDPELCSRVSWNRKGLGVHGFISAAAAGGMGALGVALPVLFIAGSSPVGAPTVTAPWPLLLFFSLMGNLYEELLFRGYLQECLAGSPGGTPAQAALTSAVAFAYAHASLATATTDAGAPLLLFCFWEGLVAAGLHANFGLVAAATAHGGAIFLMSGVL